MSKRVISWLLCIVLCMTVVSGCGINQNDVAEPSEEITEDADRPEKLPFSGDETDETDAQDDESAKQDTEAASEYDDEGWQTAYLDILDSVNSWYESNPNTEEYDKIPDSYFVYDIDKDNIPEMLVKFGTCEADYSGKFYTYRDGKAIELAQWPLGHIGFSTYPMGNGIISAWGHMGPYCTEVISLNGDSFSSEVIAEGNFNEEPEEDYKEPSDLVEGSVYLYGCRPDQNVGVTHYREIMQAMENAPEPTPEADIIDNGIGEAVPDIIENNGMVYAMDAEYYMHSGFGKPITMKDFLEKLAVIKGSKYEITASTYLDVNCDKKRECVIKVEDTGLGQGGTKWCVMSLQDGTVYVYILNVPFTDLLENGTFGYVYPDGYSSYERIVFDHENCAAYYVQPDEIHATVLR